MSLKEFKREPRRQLYHSLIRGQQERKKTTRRRREAHGCSERRECVKALGRCSEMGSGWSLTRGTVWMDRSEHDKSYNCVVN